MDNSDKMKVENQILSGQNQAVNQAGGQAVVQNAGQNTASEPQKKPEPQANTTESAQQANATIESEPKTNTAKSEPQANAEGVQFATSKIDPNKQEYFTNVKETTDKKIGKALKDYQNYRNKPENQFHPFDEKHKKTTISIIASVVLITTATLITLAVTVWKPGSEDDGNKPASVTDGASAREVGDSANDILHSGDDGYEQSNEYYEKQIALETDESKKFDLQRDYAMFIADNGDPYSAIMYLDENVDPENLKYKLDLRSLYLSYAKLYRKIDREDDALEYEKMVKEKGLDDINKLIEELE